MMLRVKVEEITESDESGMRKYLPSEEYGAIVKKIEENDLTLFRFTDGGANVRFLFEVRQGATRELFIWALFGKGLFRNITAIAAQIEHYAKHYSCTRVTGLLQYKKIGLAKLYTALGAKPVFVQFTKELTDGQ